MLNEIGETTPSQTSISSSGGNGLEIKTNGTPNVTVDGQKVGNGNGSQNNERTNKIANSASSTLGAHGVSGKGAEVLNTIAGIAKNAVNENGYFTKRMLKEKRILETKKNRFLTKEDIQRFINSVK